MKTNVVAAALMLAVSSMDRAYAGFFEIVPNTPPAAPVPEFDASSGIAVLALLVSVVAIVMSRTKRS